MQKASAAAAPDSPGKTRGKTTDGLNHLRGALTREPENASAADAQEADSRSAEVTA